MSKIGTIILCVGLVLTGCSKRPVVVAPVVPADLPEFRQGLAALHEFTPEGYARAVEHFQRASDLAPEKCEYRLQAAQASLFLALELSPRHFRSMIGLAQAISSIDEDEDVEALYKRAVDIAPDFLEGRMLLGDYYSGLEENELAREHYLAVLKRNPRFDIAQLRLG